MQTHSAHIISEAAREQLRILLKPVPLKKGDGAYEIGVEANKRDVFESISAFAGGVL